MLTEKIKRSLKDNWGDKSSALDCYAEAKLTDSISHWLDNSLSVYLFAMDQNEQIVHCIMHSNSQGPKVMEMPWNELINAYDENGEFLLIDPEFRRIKVPALIKKLMNTRN